MLWFRSENRRRRSYANCMVAAERLWMSMKICWPWRRKRTRMRNLERWFRDPFPSKQR
ncbi:unnamed protein product [Cylicostephanus goldi]|uniref:Uncharacterized protein n=1 Tax=Cylicostephanus goldi TaxID=71465 RepID=A0A3P7MDG4_CYLGO|nr:unnamed protein product [Cylicostephanus goldi]